MGITYSKSINHVNFHHPLVNKDNLDKYNFGEIKNHQTEFLVLLNQTDMLDKSFLWFNKSLKDKLEKKKFPGKLNIISFDTISDEKKYIIEDIPVPNEIYMKLPDKNLYVLSSKYNIKYFYAKQNELKNIFILLGAKKITMKIVKKNNTLESVGGDIGVNMNNIEVGGNFHIENTNSTNNQETTEMTFDYDEKIINNIGPRMFSDKDFYFLPKEYDWHNIIYRRLEQNQLTDKHILIYSNNLSFKSTFGAKLKMVGVGFDYNTQECDNLKIIYDVEYYKLNKNTNVNKNINTDIV